MPDRQPPAASSRAPIDRVRASIVGLLGLGATACMAQAIAHLRHVCAL